MRRALLIGIASFVLGVAPAQAANVTVGCGELANALSTATAGEVITLDQLCTSGFPYQLPGVSITLRGTAGAGFSGGSTAQLEGHSGSDAVFVIEGLVFEKGKNTEANASAGIEINRRERQRIYARG